MNYRLFGLALAAFVGLTSFALITNKNEPTAPVVDKLSPPETKSFKDFVAEFPKVKLPHSIKLDEAGMKVKKKNVKRLSYEYSEFIPGLMHGMVSRMGPDDYYPEAVVAQNDRYTAVIYYAVGGFRNATRYYLATYDSKGNEISTQKIMSYYAHEGHTKEAKLDKDLNLFIATNQEPMSKEADFRINRKGEIIAKAEVSKPKGDKMKAVESEVWDY